MARRRLIDPTMWQCGHFKRLNLRRRLLWIGIITMADDTGKLKGEPAVIKACVFPFDSFGALLIEKDLAELQEEGLIEPYEVEGDRYIRIPKWAKHQKPSHPTPSKIPDLPPPKDSGASPEELASDSRNLQAQGRSGKERTEKVSLEKEGDPGSSASASSGAEASPTKKRPIQGVTRESLRKLYKEHGWPGMLEALRNAGVPESEVRKVTEENLPELLGDPGSKT